MWLKRNLAVIEKRDPKLATQMNQLGYSISRLLPLSGGRYDLEFFPGKTVYGGDPIGTATNFWRRQTLKHPTLLVFYGMDLGYHLRVYLENPHPANRAILVIEKSLETFREALTAGNWTKELSDTRITWMIGLDRDVAQAEFINYFLHVDHLCFNACAENIMWLPSLERDGPYYVAMAEALKEGSETVLARVSGSPEDQYYGLSNLLGNRPYLAEAPFMDSLQGLFAGRPGVVISSGPSLDQSLPYLRDIQDKAVLIAAESAVRVLLKAGITPHFIACLERDISSLPIIQELPPLPDTWLLAIPLVYPRLIASYQGPKMFLCNRGFRYQWLLGEVPAHYLGFSVATMGYRALDLLGCEPIILVGQDLAYERDSQRSHAGGTMPFLQAVEDRRRQEASLAAQNEDWVEGNDGEKILSSKFYRLVADSFEDIIRSSGKTCLNAIPPRFGMRIPHATRMDPEQVLRGVCRESLHVVSTIRGHLNGKNEAFFSLSGMKKNAEEVRDQLKNVMEDALNRMESISRFCFENPPHDIVLQDCPIERRHEENFFRLEVDCRSYIAQQGVIEKFLWPFLIGSYLETITQYYHLKKTEDSSLKRVKQGIGFFQSWFQHLHFWAARTANLLAKI